MSDKLIVIVDSQLAALVPRFLANRTADADKTHAALAGADFQAIRVSAHGMKGAGSGYGFPAISRLGATLEEGARQRDAAAITALAAVRRLSVQLPAWGVATAAAQ